jgi:predicted nucleic acid-binding protein
MKIYLDTSVFSHYFDNHPIFFPATVQLFKEIDDGKFEAFTSVYVVDELKVSESPKRDNMLSLLQAFNVKVLPENGLANEIASS